jgi:GT2 family glycosyltransferase
VTTPLISAFIVNYNTCALLQQCLKSIFDNTENLDIEVFVADNNSSDGSSEMVRAQFPEVSLVRYARNIGYTKAINPMLRVGKGEYYLLLHPDLLVLPDTLARFVEFFEAHPLAGILGANLYYPDGTPNPSETSFPCLRNDSLSFAMRLVKRIPGGREFIGSHNPLEWSHKSTSQVHWVWNACMIVRKKVFETIGYFDENFYVWYADWDLCKRATDAGWTVYYLHAATAIHYERQSFVKDDIMRDEIRYKVDGWYSAPRQIKDRHIFIKKHGSVGSINGVKALYILENVLRLWVILCRVPFRRATSKEASFQVRACLQTIQAIQKA